MITEKVTDEQLKSWKESFEANSASLVANRRLGEEVDRYFTEKYSPEAFASERFIEVVRGNLMLNEFSREKLSAGTAPDIKAYRLGDVVVGIDIETGFFHVESAEIDKAARIYDDLFVFRGLDDADMKNYVLVGQYIDLTR